MSEAASDSVPAAGRLFSAGSVPEAGNGDGFDPPECGMPRVKLGTCEVLVWKDQRVELFSYLELTIRAPGYCGIVVIYIVV